MNVKSSLTFDSMLIPYSLRILVFFSFSLLSFLAKKSELKTNEFLDCNSIVVYSKFLRAIKEFSIVYCFTAF